MKRRLEARLEADATQRPSLRSEIASARQIISLASRVHGSWVGSTLSNQKTISQPTNFHEHFLLVHFWNLAPWRLPKELVWEPQLDSKLEKKCMTLETALKGLEG